MNDEMETAAKPIRDSPAVAAPAKARPADGSESTRPYINDQLNSRLPASLRRPALDVRWESKLDPENPPAFVLQAGDRIVLQGQRRWWLFDGQGKQIKVDIHGPGDVVLDPAAKQIRMIDEFGRLDVHRAADGEREYTASLYLTDRLYRAFFARRGRRLVVASFERAMNPHPKASTFASYLESQDLGEPMEVRSEVLASARRDALIDWETPRIFAAATADTVFAAVKNEIFIGDFALKSKGRFSGEFSPGPLSVDEAGRMYLFVKVGETLALWCLNASGERLWTHLFPPDSAVTAAPPVIGYDHKVYVHSPAVVTCLGPDGKAIWTKTAGGSIAGMAVSADDQLVVSAGSKLIAFDGKGTARTLRDFAGDSLITPPAATRDGALLVASRAKLYRLE